jgi:GDP-4-dehydro-6-deoxy-D-mannose reductase
MPPPCGPLVDEDVNVDLHDADRLRRAPARIAPDAVIHLAAQSFVPESFARPRETYEINFFGTLNLLDALKAAGFTGRLLFVGSGDCYGVVAPNELPIDEAQPLRPRSPYAVSRAAPTACPSSMGIGSPSTIAKAAAFMCRAGSCSTTSRRCAASSS